MRSIPKFELRAATSDSGVVPRRRFRRAPPRAFAFAAAAVALIFGFAGAFAMLNPSAGAQALLTASIVATILASIAGIYAAAPPAPIQKRAAEFKDHIEKTRDARWRLADDEARYRQLLDAQDDLIERRSADGRIMFVNSAFCAAFAAAFDDILATRFFPHVLAAEQQRAAPGERSRIVELIDTAQGPRWISWEEQRIEGTGGAETQRVGRDVTSDRRLLGELNAARDQAESASRAKSRFLASMSHEIRTPMNGILGMTSLLAETDLTESQRTYARAVDESARALLSLIDEILDFSKIEAGRLELEAEAFSVRACVARTIELLGPRADDKGLSLTWSIDADVPDRLIGDEARVRQILLNLLSNAVKFTDVGGVLVRVYCIGRAAGGNGPLRLGIDVADTGMGFSAEAMRRLFEEFDQGDAATERRHGGAGLGLAISERLARAMGGEITAEGQPGKGATFKVVLRLPSAPSQPAHVDTPPAPASRRVPKLQGRTEAVARFASLHDIRVLIAEDNAINALLARRVVERLGGEPLVVADGAAAVEVMRASLEDGALRFDLVLMDMFMPVMDGLEASRAIAMLFAESSGGVEAAPPIIALTANAYPEDRARCLAAGMSDYLAKPFDSAQLQALVTRWLPPAV